MSAIESYLNFSLFDLRRNGDQSEIAVLEIRASIVAGWRMQNFEFLWTIRVQLCPLLVH